MPAPTTPFQPYLSQHAEIKGPGDGRPTCEQILKDCNVIGKLRDKIFLITGCTSGIGQATAQALYETGAKLFVTARDMSKIEGVIDDIVSKASIKEAPRPQAIEMRLDSLESVRKGADTFQKLSGGKLNILINNAGVMAPPFGRTEDGFDIQLGTNHMAHFLLFQLLKPLLIKSAKESGTLSRVINVSSAAHHWSSIQFDNLHWTESTYNKMKAYGQSKTANILMANALHRYYGDQGLIGLSVHPGTIHTELGRHFTDEEIAAAGGLEKFYKTAKNTDQGAATTVWAAVSPHFEKVENGGRYLADSGEAAPQPQGAAPDGTKYAAHAYDEPNEDKLWKESCNAVGVPL